MIVPRRASVHVCILTDVDDVVVQPCECEAEPRMDAILPHLLLTSLDPAYSRRGSYKLKCLERIAVVSATPTPMRPLARNEFRMLVKSHSDDGWHFTKLSVHASSKSPSQPRLVKYALRIPHQNASRKGGDAIHETLSQMRQRPACLAHFIRRLTIKSRAFHGTFGARCELLVNGNDNALRSCGMYLERVCR